MSAKGKTVLVTGATDGIGRATALGLAEEGARVLVHGRDPRKGAEIVAAIRQASGNNAVEFIEGDFNALAGVRALADAVKARAAPLDVLINNAGTFNMRRSLTADGYEATFAINHLAPFLLTNLVLDLVQAAAPSRIVNVSSAAHRGGALAFDDLMGERRYSGWRAYQQSKLANVLFTRALARRLHDTGVTVNALHPGVVRTGLGQNNPLLKLLGKVITPLIAVSPEKGARTSLHLATAPEMACVTGQYFSDCAPAPIADAAADDALGERLWQVSAKLTGLDP